MGSGTGEAGQGQTKGTIKANVRPDRRIPSQKARHSEPAAVSVAAAVSATAQERHERLPQPAA
jgi:hypothetical protein